MTVPDLDTAIREANNTRFGLGASIWTSNLASTKRAFDEIRAGIIWVNRHLTVHRKFRSAVQTRAELAGRTGTVPLTSIQKQKHCS